MENPQVLPFATTTSTNTNTSTSNSTQISCHESPDPETSMEDTPPPEEHPDPQMDRQFVLAIVNHYTPIVSNRAARSSCTHSLIKRIRAPHASCFRCGQIHIFGWLYRCRMCGYKACHNCRPRFLERSWDNIWGVIEDSYGRGKPILGKQLDTTYTKE
ncbi:hypothetical protein EDC01DRAFT_12313 [Geopyxis carbonaria]|nr:hypothetical protein EDC01DRAFT_12313 [Geopyxis carbonaria]